MDSSYNTIPEWLVGEILQKPLSEMSGHLAVPLEPLYRSGQLQLTGNTTCRQSYTVLNSLKWTSKAFDVQHGSCSVTVLTDTSSL